MKAFWIFAGLLTVAYIIYYVVNICLDLYGKPKEQEQPMAEEDFDLKGMQVMEEAKAVEVTDGGFRIGESETVVKPKEDAHPAEVDSPAPKLDATGAPLTPVQQKIEDVKAKMEETELEMSRENTADMLVSAIKGGEETELVKEKTTPVPTTPENNNEGSNEIKL